MKIEGVLVVVKGTENSAREDLIWGLTPSSLSVAHLPGAEVVGMYAGPDAEIEANIHATAILRAWAHFRDAVKQTGNIYSVRS